MTLYFGVKHCYSIAIIARKCYNYNVVVDMLSEKEIETYKHMYYHLFNAVTDALQDLECQDCTQAAARLIRAQQETEAKYIALEDENIIVF